MALDMVTYGGYACGKHRIMHRDVEPLCCIPDTNVPVGVSYTQIKILIKTKDPFAYSLECGLQGIR